MGQPPRATVKALRTAVSCALALVLAATVGAVTADVAVGPASSAHQLGHGSALAASVDAGARRQRAGSRRRQASTVRMLGAGSGVLAATKGQRVALRAAVTPAARGRRVFLQRQTGRGWKNLGRARTARTGVATVSVTATGPVTYRYRVPATRRWTGATSPSVRVVPRVPTGAPEGAPPGAPTGSPGPGPTPAGSTDYSFIYTDGLNRPARWNPCKAITWRYNPIGEWRPSNLVDLKAAVAQLSTELGITFSYLGTTTDLPYRRGAGDSTDEDLLIGWGTAASVPGLAGSTIGLAGPSFAWGYTGSVPNAPEIVDAEMVLDSQDGPLPAGFGSRSFGALALHELGHTAGLGHAAGRSELMYPSMSSANDGRYQVGDRAGLRLLGATQGCFAKPRR